MPSSRKFAKFDFEALSEFRYQFQGFLRFGDHAGESQGLTPQQYLLLLHIKGFPGRETATIGVLVERLQVLQHGNLALVNRWEAAGLAARTVGTSDRRQVVVSIIALGEERLRCLAALHRTELRSLKNVFQVANISAFNDEERQDATSST